MKSHFYFTRYYLNQNGLQLAKEVNVNVDDDNLVSYVSLKKLLQESRCPWSQRYNFVNDNHVWFGGRYLYLLITWFV